MIRARERRNDRNPDLNDLNNELPHPYYPAANRPNKNAIPRERLLSMQAPNDNRPCLCSIRSDKRAPKAKQSLQRDITPRANRLALLPMGNRRNQYDPGPSWRSPHHAPTPANWVRGIALLPTNSLDTLTVCMLAPWSGTSRLFDRGHSEVEVELARDTLLARSRYNPSSSSLTNALTEPEIDTPEYPTRHIYTGASAAASSALRKDMPEAPVSKFYTDINTKINAVGDENVVRRTAELFEQRGLMTNGIRLGRGSGHGYRVTIGLGRAHELFLVTLKSSNLPMYWC
ncbi:hypothetical protein EVG20_g8530 [Dentipellis fragilis]|uniref:Uncharacterized protein n=1 Tax=Dentipellis fragilis TaxID=205917 RepID=A0A4Y9Y9G2_9AGAM|nr:hypothetical protein EVG20_g8530 [Dentipellis fragilis]